MPSWQEREEFVQFMREALSKRRHVPSWQEREEFVQFMREALSKRRHVPSWQEREEFVQFMREALSKRRHVPSWQEREEFVQFMREALSKRRHVPSWQEREEFVQFMREALSKPHVRQKRIHYLLLLTAGIIPSTGSEGHQVDFDSFAFNISGLRKNIDREATCPHETQNLAQTCQLLNLHYVVRALLLLDPPRTASDLEQQGGINGAGIRTGPGCSFCEWVLKATQNN